MTSKVRGDRQVGHYLTAASLADIRSSAEALLLANEKSGAAAVADALIKASETMPYNVRAQFAIDLSKACISRGNTSLFEGILDALLSQAPLSTDDAIDDLDFALDEADADDTFVDVKTSNRSNMHSRHTHHHLGLTMACFSSTAKQRYLLALHDPNTLMYPKVASLLCSYQRSSPVTPDTELIALISHPNAVPRRVRALLSACMAHKRIAVCDALASHFWTNHHRDRCALLLPSCSASFLRNFLADCPDVMAERDFNPIRFLKLQPHVSLDLFEAKLKVSPPLLRQSTWKHGPFRQPFLLLEEWFEPLLQQQPAAHERLAALSRSYPAHSIVRTDAAQSRVSVVNGNRTVTSLSGVVPMFPLCSALKRCLPDRCKVRGKSHDFWSVWFPLVLDSVAVQCQPVLTELNVLSAFDTEAGREAAKSILLKLLPPEDQQNELLVACILRSHTSADVNAFHQIDAQKFNAMVSAARDLCNHPAMSRSFYHDHKSIFDLPLSHEQYCAVYEKILSAANQTEAHSSLHSIHLVSNLKLNEAFANVVSSGARDLHGPCRPLAAFAAFHRLPSCLSFAAFNSF
jgi:hypothetical protein